MDKKTVIFVIVVAVLIGSFVAYKMLFGSKPIAVGREFALQVGEMVTVNTEDKTKIKLVSINPVDGCTEDGECDDDLEFNLIINGENHVVTSIPNSIDMYNAFELFIVDGDEDHIVLKVQRK